MEIDTIIKFNIEKDKHLKNLNNIRDFILGDKNNQPQVTYCPKIAEFDRLYNNMKEWIETSYFDNSED